MHRHVGVEKGRAQVDLFEEKHDKLFTGKTARNYKKSTWWAPVFCHFKNYMDIDMREFM